MMIVSLSLATGKMALANGKNHSKPQTPNTAQSGQTGDQAYIVKEVRH